MFVFCQSIDDRTAWNECFAFLTNSISFKGSDWASPSSGQARTTSSTIQSSCTWSPPCVRTSGKCFSCFGELFLCFVKEEQIKQYLFRRCPFSSPSISQPTMLFHVLTKKDQWNILSSQQHRSCLSRPLGLHLPPGEDRLRFFHIWTHKEGWILMSHKYERINKGGIG